MKTSLLWRFWMLGLASVVLVQTSFVPDEYWQSLEVAHRIVFGYGELTWEWKEGIRSCAYPLSIAFVYKILHVLRLDFVALLVYVPRVLQATISALGHFHTCKLANILYGKQAVPWTAIALSSSWVLFYCMSRTLYNTVETALTLIALTYYPWDGKLLSKGNVIRYLNLAALTVLIRPTSIIIWLPLCLRHLFYAWKYSSKLLLECICFYFVIGFFAICSQLVLDYVCYGRWIFTPLNFLRFNLLSDHSSHYGSHPWHWYFTQGLGILLTTHLLPLILAVRSGKHKTLFRLCFWLLFVYSFSAHKEFRFILPIVPLCCCIVGSLLAELDKKTKAGFKNPAYLITFLLFSTNIPVAFYFGLVHQRGVTDVMMHVQSESKSNQNMTVLFLMPCHSTPAYSHVHKNITMKFISCEPNLLSSSNYEDESDLFYKNPDLWLEKTYSSYYLTHVVLFDILRHNVSHFLERRNFSLSTEFFHSHVSDGRIGKSVQIYCQKIN